MKLYSKITLPVLVGMMIIYTSCNKLPAVKPAPQTQAISADFISSQVAMGFTNTVSGSYGGVNLNAGVDSIALSNYQGPQHSSNQDLLCGFFNDTKVSYYTNSGDTRSHTSGNLNFYFDCVNGKSTGYTAYDSLTTTGKAPLYTFAYTVKQYYQIKSMNQSNTMLFVNGQLTSAVEQNFDNKATKPIIDNTYYILKDLTVDLGNKGDIKSGTAAFTSNGSNSYGAWKYDGTIIFYGNHKADIIIDGKVFHADLITGKITS